MSYSSLLKHRCNILELTEMQVDGLASHSWSIVAANVRCFLDLNYIRSGKDPLLWTPEAGRAQDRSGVLFLLPSAPVKSGQRINVIKGPSGIFSIEGAVDEVWSPRKFHHYECGVQEIGRPIANGAPTA